ncbi:MAG TPA: hypothetical protein VFJ52_09135, partial [Terriglobia bacterium]|nr:hypothetical protein [Terriglobia bacterium]
HGYGLDPWELRIPLCLDGPGVPEGTDDRKALSLLAVRDAVAKRLLDGTPIQPGALLAADDAPMRMHALNFTLRADQPHDYREMDPHEFIEGVRVLPDGVWFMKYKASPEQREEDLSYAEAHGRILKTYRPLIRGGARLFTYDGYDLVSTEELTQQAFDKAKQAINRAFLKPWNRLAPAPQ